MPNPAVKTPTVLIIRDGWGANPHPEHDQVNAVKLARTPAADRIAREYPRTLIATCCMDVGLPDGTMGNSEVGHQNLGAGRIVDQESVRITRAIREGRFFENEVLVEACRRVVDGGGKLHLFGIVSDAGVHGLLEHLYGCLELAKRQSVPGHRVLIHAFTDGRDTPPFSGKDYVQQVEVKCREMGIGRIASVVGRYYAMDRDNRWDRVQHAYDLLTGRGGFSNFANAAEAVQEYYEHATDVNRRGDEFVTPRTVGQRPWETRVAAGDSVIFYNYRGDRPRELTKAFVLDDFSGFARGPKLDLYYATMTAYEQGLPVAVAFPKPPKMTGILGEYISKLGQRQFRCAETEKYPHVTFFFNDYRDDPFPGEDRQIIPSPKEVSTYDQRPEMSAYGVAEETAGRIRSGLYDLVVVNFANPDMVGHTGVLKAAVRACEVVDECVGKVLEAVGEMGGRAIVTADHGNAEQMTLDGKPGGPAHTAHTLYKVELVVVDERFKGCRLREGGRLADVAPTLLEMMGLKKPREMTGESLIVG
jgi:2,3-bisphosphoglycerate-independent phosphoglycerate mutase